MFHPDKKVIQCVDGELSLGLICACFNCTNCKSTSLKDDDNRAPLELAIEGEHDECARTLAPCCLCASLAHEDTYGWSCPTCRARLCGVCRAQMHKGRLSNPTLRARQQLASTGENPVVAEMTCPFCKVPKVPVLDRSLILTGGGTKTDRLFVVEHYLLRLRRFPRESTQEANTLRVVV